MSGVALKSRCTNTRKMPLVVFCCSYAVRGTEMFIYLPGDHRAQRFETPVVATSLGEVTSPIS